MLNYPWAMFLMGFAVCLLLVIGVGVWASRTVYQVFVCVGCGLEKEITEPTYSETLYCSKCSLQMLRREREKGL